MPAGWSWAPAVWAGELSTAAMSSSRKRRRTRSISHLANSAIVVQYADGGQRRGARVRLAKPFARRDREAAAMPVTSYSNRPGSVSSKSFRSNSSVAPARRTRRNSTDARRRTTERPAGRALEVRGHDLRRTPVERERGNHHPAADRHEVGLDRLASRLEQCDRVGRSPAGPQPAWADGAAAHAIFLRSTFVDARMLDLDRVDGLDLLSGSRSARCSS